MSINLFTTPTLYNGVTLFFDPLKSFMVDGTVYDRGEYKMISYKGLAPFNTGEYQVFYLVSKENEHLSITVPTPCYKWQVDGVSFTDPSLLSQAIYNGTIDINSTSNSASILQQISDKLPTPKVEPNHYSGNGTITFPANTQSSISIKAIGNLQVTINGITKTLQVDDTISLSTQSILNKEIIVVGNYYIVAVGDKII